MDVKLAVVVREEAVRLVSPVVLSPQPPINVREDGLIIKVYRGKDTTAYLTCPLRMDAK